MDLRNYRLSLSLSLSLNTFSSLLSNLKSMEIIMCFVILSDEHACTCTLYAFTVLLYLVVTSI
jgi:hypothetical protein